MHPFAQHARQKYQRTGRGWLLWRRVCRGFQRRYRQWEISFHGRGLSDEQVMLWGDTQTRLLPHGGIQRQRERNIPGLHCGRQCLQGVVTGVFGGGGRRSGEGNGPGFTKGRRRAGRLGVIQHGAQVVLLQAIPQRIAPRVQQQSHHVRGGEGDDQRDGFGQHA